MQLHNQHLLLHWRAPLLHGPQERCDLAQGVGVVADQGMTAGWKDDSPAVGHAGGKILRPTGRAEPIVFGVSVSGTISFAIMIVPGAVMITAVNKCRASMPKAM